MSSKTKAAGTKEEARPTLVPKLRFPEFRSAKGWVTKPFDQLFTVGNGRDYKHLESGIVPVYGSGGYMLSVNDYLHDGESVCIGRKGTINNPMFLSGRFWTVDTLFYTHSFKECLPKFIFAIFQQIDWLKHNEAGGVPSLSKTNIQKILTSVPNLAEQQKIAEFLSSVDEVIAAQARKVDALKTHKKGLMQQLFPLECETQPRLRFPEFQDTEYWQVKRLDELVDIQSGATPSKANPEFWVGSIPWVSAKDMKRLFLDDAEDHISEEAVYDGARLVSAGTLLVLTRGMTLLKDVPICVLRREMSFNQDIKGLRPKNGVNGLFLAWMLTASKHRLLAMVNVAGHGTGKLDTEKLKAFELAVPLPGEQQSIASCLSSLDTLITAETQKLEALKTHKKGLMQQLFPSSEHVAA